jgi:hypothetical protein
VLSAAAIRPSVASKDTSQMEPMMPPVFVATEL